jgi:hypothetical protein
VLFEDDLEFACFHVAILQGVRTLYHRD